MWQKSKKRKPSDKISLRTNQNYQREAFYENKYNRRNEISPVVEYAIKYNNNARAARRYKTSRQQVQRWRKKYDGPVQSLANQSRRPHKHPKQHTEKEIKLIQNKYQRHKHEGQVYRKSIDAGYKRGYESMCRQIKKFKNYENGL